MSNENRYFSYLCYYRDFLGTKIIFTKHTLCQKKIQNPKFSFHFSYLTKIQIFLKKIFEFFFFFSLFDPNYFFSASAATISDDDETERNVITEDASQNQFERHKFPRDSGCFASSSPASDRSSQQSHSESGIHDFEMDESLPSIKQRSSPEKSAQVSQQRRSLRDRHTLNTHELQILNLNGSSSSPPNRKDSFEVLVEKYVTEKTPLEHGRVRDARSIFENGCN